MDRTSFIQSMKNLSMKVTMEEQANFYKNYVSSIPKIATVMSIKEMKGGRYETTSISGESELYEREEKEQVQFKDPVEGYPITIKKRSFDLGVEMSVEADEDFEGIKDFFKTYLKSKGIPEAVERTKQKFVASFFNKGGIVLGSKKPFNNDISGISPIFTTYGNYCYDSKPLFNLSGNNRSAKNHATTYYNNLGVQSLTYDNLLSMDTLYCSTNAKMENGEPFDNTQDNYLMTGTALRMTAKKILESPGNPTNANHEKNVLSGNYEPICNPFITGASAWYVGNKKGLLFFDNNQVDYDFWFVGETRVLRGTAHISIGGGVINWRRFGGATVPTA